MAKYILRSKYHNTQEDWVKVYKNISSYISREEVEEKINKTIEKIKEVIKDKNVAYAWSGGKDSLVLQIIMEKMGINKGIAAISKELEYPSFLKFFYEHLPVGMEVRDMPVEFEYLRKHPELIFPVGSINSDKWDKMIHLKAQNNYVKENNIDILIMGRRKQDGNFVGKDNIYSRKDGISIYSPLADWKHEDILATLYYYDLKLPEIYFMTDGFNLGTHNVFARMGNKRECLEEIYKHDKNIWEKLAPHFDFLKEFLNGK